MSAVNNHPTHGQVSPSGVHGYVMDSYRPVRGARPLQVTCTYYLTDELSEKR
jgi:hypothetical protein